jgi:diguanylate cyclase (GGDEF)-like protein
VSLGYSCAVEMKQRVTTTHDLLDSVAETTTHRDRDELDKAVVRLLTQFLETRSVTLLRLIDDASTKRVASRVTASPQHGEVVSPATDNPSDLPALADFPDWQDCVLRNEVVRCSGADGRLTTVFPIHGGRAVVGLLVIETTALLTMREVDLVQGVLGIVRNHLALLDYGELDTLTGLLNRRTFEGHFDKLRQRMLAVDTGPVEPSAAARDPSWLALIDIDRFKSINDGYGHLFGDEVLLLVSQLMKRTFRGADQLFRFGGEEFVVVLERASEAGARIVFERLRTTIEEYKFPQVGRVTVSVGYTRIDARDVATICVERADSALYYAKSHGRNNVQSCEELVAAGEISTRKGSDVELF